MADIFISYKSERRPAARHLAKVLRAYGYDVWYDYGLIPGDDFEPRINAEIEAARVVVVLWCTMASESSWVIKEATKARTNGAFLPCRLEASALPPAFAGADTINLSEWDGAPRSHMLDRLLADIARRVGRNPTMDFNTLRELDEDWRGYGAPALAQFALGKTLTPGVGTVPELATQSLGAPPAGITANLAEHWANAQQGVASALSAVAWAFLSGSDGLRQDDVQAVRLLKLSAGQGHAIAQANLAFMHDNGRGGLAQNGAEAVRLYKLAADQGYAYAQFNLGVMHAKGQGGLSQNEAEAARLYKLAAEQGYASAQSNLGVLHMDGAGGLQKSDEAAIELYQLAAEQGHAKGQYNLGYMYANGRGGLPANELEAVRLYTLSAQQGNADAQEALKRRNLSW